MFQRMIDDVKDSTGHALRMTFLAAAAGLALFVTTSFLCAAAFVAVLQKYGPVEACFAGAGVFFLLALIAAGSYLVRKRQAKARAAEAARSAVRTTLADPMVVAAALQVLRTVGVKRLVPLIAIGGVALGLFAASRRDASDQTPAE
jgi:prepilin signal peptidase PulO-like enzyme (type II secretory pathway)